MYEILTALKARHSYGTTQKTQASSYLQSVSACRNGMFKIYIYQTQSLDALTSFKGVLTGTKSIFSTPLPLA